MWSPATRAARREDKHACAHTQSLSLSLSLFVFCVRVILSLIISARWLPCVPPRIMTQTESDRDARALSLSLSVCVPLRARVRETETPSALARANSGNGYDRQYFCCCSRGLFKIWGWIPKIVKTRLLGIYTRSKTVCAKEFQQTTKND